MYEKDPETGAVDFSHNPFSMPQGGLMALEGDPLEVLGFQYDLAVQRLRNRVRGDPQPQARDHAPGLRVAGYPPGEVEARFPGLSTAFRYGRPAQGGCAAGIDRIR